MSYKYNGIEGPFTIEGRFIYKLYTPKDSRHERNAFHANFYPDYSGNSEITESSVEATACLCAAAPDLLDALIDLVQENEGRGLATTEMSTAITAIEKALNYNK